MHHGKIVLKPEVYLSRELESSLKGYIEDLGYLPKPEIDILKEAKFACMCSEEDVSREVGNAINSGVPVILVGNENRIPEHLKEWLERDFSTHKHACFEAEESKHVIKWIDYCFEKVVDVRIKKVSNKEDKMAAEIIKREEKS